MTYRLLRHPNERLNVKYNLTLNKELKAKLLYLGGSKFLRKAITIAWDEKIQKDNIAMKLNEQEAWDEMIKALSLVHNKEKSSQLSSFLADL